MRGTWGKRGFVATIAAVCCASGVALNASPAVAASKLVAAGTVHCTATGSINVGPQLSATPNPKTKLIVKAKFACTQGETGNSAVTVVSGSMTAKFGLLTADCTTTNFGGGSAIVQWKTNGGSLAKSMFTWASATLTDGSSVTLDLTGPGGAETGSYQGSSHTMHIVGDATTGGICGPVAKGKVVKFTGANGASTLDITPPNPNNLPVNHVVVLMQENRSADTYFGPLSTQGQAGYEPEPTTGNPDPTNPGGPAIVPFHKTTYCEVADLDHSWTGTHNEYDGGAMDGFTAQNAIAQDPTGSRAMGYYDQTDLPFYYSLYNTFATGDRYFSSLLSQTFPNRLYLLAGTSFGHIRNDVGNSTQKSVFELLDARSVTWKIYAAQYPLSYGSLFFKYVADRATAHVFPMSQYFADAANGALPAVAFVDPKLTGTAKTENDEHPPSNVQVGQKFVADVTNALMASPDWGTSAMFLTYDEHGGFYDHVPPPAAVAPDNIAPMLQPGDTVAGFDRLGIRVPAVVISPYAKAHYVSHVVHDHTSILHFIETRFGLPTLTARDAAADPMMEFFDFNSATFATPPTLAPAVVDPAQLAACPG